MGNIKICTLYFIVLLSFLVETESAICCLRYVKNPRRCGFLKGYDIQIMTEGCDLPAIIFHTVTGRSICANPSQNWTQERVLCLKKKAETMKTKTMSMFTTLS
ncbi:C-C motif chemokine 20b precursor [Danio rerio]|uniref:C-C motif chemokine n=1 Tax=Danio rerio TaxID=7955 RepID=A9ZPE0_DANRE|nr:C-C motif chemokine 20b precursor [Danio rerio]BAF98248.1 chemokine CCL-C24a [Danio rerio]|eukprot:NP_001107067.1 chemokine (C-C motif) ligand 20b precursor [Danio rerio]